MDPAEAAAIRERMLLTAELFVAGEEMMRQKLRREFPEASDTEIERRLGAWFRERPGAEFGDAPGRPRPLRR